MCKITFIQHGEKQQTQQAIAELLRLDFAAVLNNVAPQLVTYWCLVAIPTYITSKKEQTNMLSKSEGYQIKGCPVVYKIQNHVKSSKII